MKISHIINGKYIIEPQTNERAKQNLIIEKVTGNVSLGSIFKYFIF